MPWKIILRAHAAKSKTPLERWHMQRRLPCKKTRKKTNAARPAEKATYANQNNPGQPWFCITHTTYGGSRTPEKKGKKKAYLFSGQCGIFTTSRRFRQRYRNQASGSRNIGRESDLSLDHAQRRKNGTKQKNQSRLPLEAWNIRQQSNEGKAFKYYAQYPVMQESQGEKMLIYSTRVPTLKQTYQGK